MLFIVTAWPLIEMISSPSLMPASCAALCAWPSHLVKADTSTREDEGRPISVSDAYAISSAITTCMKEPAEANNTWRG